MMYEEPNYIYGRPKGRVRKRSQVLTDKSKPFRTFLHYSDSDARKQLTVFGAEKPGLFYNYDDRLFGDRWNQGLRIASEQAVKGTARFYEIALNHFHSATDVDLQHVILGCNTSNGQSYLVFGYTYTPQESDS